MNWFKSLSTIGKIGVGIGIFFLCGLLAQLAPKQQLSNDELVSSAVAQMQQSDAEKTQTSSSLAISEATEILVPTETQIPTATPNPNLVNEGTHLVGTDIQAGLYRGNAGFDLLDSCYWARLSDLSGEFSGLISNDNALGQFYIQVSQTDMALEVACEIELLPELIQNPAGFPETILPGTYLVGFDIQPGTYRGEAGTDILDSCYWARLSDVSGEFSGLIANDNATGQFYVQVSQSDFAFSADCEMTRVGD